MTRKGAQTIIENLSLRIFDIQGIRYALAKEEQELRARIYELELAYENDYLQIQDKGE